MAWYQRQWWYIERPFPWLPLLACAIPVGLIAFAVTLGIEWKW